jgi:hypothetical protein
MGMGMGSGDCRQARLWRREVWCGYEARQRGGKFDRVRGTDDDGVQGHRLASHIANVFTLQKKDIIFPRVEIAGSNVNQGRMQINLAIYGGETMAEG